MPKVKMISFSVFHFLTLFYVSQFVTFSRSCACRAKLPWEVHKILRAQECATRMDGLRAQGSLKKDSFLGAFSLNMVDFAEIRKNS